MNPDEEDEDLELKARREREDQEIRDFVEETRRKSTRLLQEAREQAKQQENASSA